MKAKFFDAAVGSKLVKLVRLRYLDDVPLCLETTYLPPSFGALIDRDINGSLYATLRQEFHRAPAQGHKTFEVCYASQNEAFLLNVERGQALILITDYVYDTDGFEEWFFDDNFKTIAKMAGINQFTKAECRVFGNEAYIHYCR